MNAGELWLLQHYQEQVARSLSVVPDEINSFIKLFIPMAMLQPAMRNALMGLSATHLKRKHPEWGVSAVEYQNKAVKLANALLIKGGEENMMEGLATVLFLCLQEVIFSLHRLSSLPNYSRSAKVNPANGRCISKLP